MKWVRDTGAKIRFVTNNPRFSRDFYYMKLNELGIHAEMDEIVTSSQLTAAYLRKNPEYGDVFIIGESQLRSELLDAGISLVEHPNPDTVVISFDTTLTYEKLMLAYHGLMAGARFIATNPDAVCPTPDGGSLMQVQLSQHWRQQQAAKLRKLSGSRRTC
ncbi:HAD-IIA family hydrolase [Bacillus sp. N9]